MQCWGHFHVIVRPQVFAWQVWLVDRPMKAWWHRALQLISEYTGAVSCWIPRLILEEHMTQNTVFSLIGCGPGLVSTSLERSNNFEGSQILFEMEVRRHLWKDKKMGTECKSRVPDGICKCMVASEIDGMQEWCNVIIAVYNVIELGD